MSLKKSIGFTKDEIIAWLENWIEDGGQISTYGDDRDWEIYQAILKMVKEMPE